MARADAHLTDAGESFRVLACLNEEVTHLLALHKCPSKAHVLKGLVLHRLCYLEEAGSLWQVEHNGG